MLELWSNVFLCSQRERLRLDSSWRVRINFFVPRTGQDEKHLSLQLFS